MMMIVLFVMKVRILGVSLAMMMMTLANLMIMMMMMMMMMMTEMVAMMISGLTLHQFHKET